MQDHLMVQEMAERVRALNEDQQEATRLDRAVQTARDLIGGCAHAGITMVHQREVSTAAATDDVVERGDRLQYQLDEGPCLDAIREQTTVISHHLAEDRRWPIWAPAVHRELGVSAMLSLLLFANHQSFGALNLYGRRRQAFDADDLAVATALATHIGVAMRAGREITHRGVAMGTRTVIGQAEGILMERYDLTAEVAFALLQRLSQASNRKLVDLATELATTRQLSELPPVRV